MRNAVMIAACTVALCIGATGPACADDAKPAYPAMAPLQQYYVANAAAEIALARSAAPKSIADRAEILTFGEHGYETAAKGKNGFVCLVERAWAMDFDSPEFWNPKLRSPMCLNAAAARSILPSYLERTKWVLSGIAVPEMLQRTKSELDAKTFPLPAAGAMSYMMSKQGYLNDAAGHWHSHVMFYQARTAPAAWGANLDDSPLVAVESHPEPITTFMVRVSRWSDGTPSDTEMP